MSITVKDVLQLDLFRNTKVLAGKDGLNRIVNRVSVFDCPIQIERDLIVLKEGDFFVSNFYFWKDDYDEAIFAIDFLNSRKCSCLCITSEYLEYFSEEMAEHCNKINFPILTIDYSVSYGDIMKSVYLLMVEDQRNIIHEMQLINLIKTKDTLEINKIINEINPHFLGYVTTIYCYSNDPNFKFSKHFRNTVNESKQNFCIPYKNGIIIILTYNNMTDSKITSYVNYYLELIKSNIKDYIVGISNNSINLIDIQESISQAVLSCTSRTIKSDSIVFYGNLGSFSLLLSFKDTPVIKSIYNNTIVPIIQYDKIHNKDLLHTLISFVECCGDYKKTAQLIYQHENTVRYRVLKVKSLLGLEDSTIEFYERISLGVKLHKIYKQMNSSF
jgi:purine catabolism regulator